MAKEIIVDFTKEEESSGGGQRYPEGDYVGKVKSMKYIQSKEKKTPGIQVDYVITFPDKYKGKKARDTLWLTPKALSRVREFLNLCGVAVPKKKFKINVDKCIGKEVGFSFENEEREIEKNGKTTTRVFSRIGWEFLDAQAVKESDFEPDDDGDDDGTTVDVKSMDEDELRAHAKKLGVKGVKKMDKKALKKAIKAAEEDDDVEDVDLDDDF